jgi:hypothetical protein
MNEEDHSEGLGIDDMIVIKWFLNKLDSRTCT